MNEDKGGRGSCWRSFHSGDGDCNCGGRLVSLTGAKSRGGADERRSVFDASVDAQPGVSEDDPVADAAAIGEIDFDGERGGIAEIDADGAWSVAAADDLIEGDAFVDPDDQLGSILTGITGGKGVVDADEAIELFELLAEVPGDFGGGMECDAASEFAAAKPYAGMSADTGDPSIESRSPEEAFEFGLFGESGDGAACGFDAEEANVAGFEFGERTESAAAEVCLTNE